MGDEATFRGEIYTVLKEQFRMKELCEKTIVSLRKACGSAQTATMTTSGASAEAVSGRKSSNRMRSLRSEKANIINKVLQVRKHAPMARFGPIYTEFVGRKANLPRNAIGTPNAYRAQKEGTE